MLLIWGTKVRRKVKDSGNFECPFCSETQEYEIISLRKYFTVFFIPVIPLKRLGTYWECSNCESAWRLKEHETEK